MFAGNYRIHQIGMGVALLVATVCGIASARADDADSIRPYAGNPYYWHYKDEPVLLLGGSWQDNLFNHPTGLAQHLDLLVASGGNYVRNTMSHRNQGNVFAYAQREDGKFDLDKFNEEYWQRFDDFLRMTHERDIIVQIEVWDPWDYFADHQSQGGWSKNPFNPANNLTYTAEESGLSDAIDYNPARTPSQHAFWRTVPALLNNEVVLRYQRAFVDKMLSIALRYPHALYCVHNESGEELTFSAYWADHIHRRAREAGRTVFVTDMRYDINIVQPDHHVIYDDPQRYTFLDISQNNQQSGQTHYDRILHVRDYLRAKPRPLNNTKIYNLRGGDEESVARMFRILLAGGASARFHRPHPLEDASAREQSSHYGLGLSPRGRAALRSARMLADAMNIFVCEPRNDLLDDRLPIEAYCLAEPGRQYAVYFPDGGSMKLDVSEAEGPLQVRWLDIDRSAWQQRKTADGGGTLELKTPGTGHWAVLVLSQESAHWRFSGEVGQASVGMVVSVKEHGARGDGRTDDRVAIQNAVDAVAKAGGGTVFFPEGVYMVTAPNKEPWQAQLVLRDGLTLQGEGMFRSVIRIADDQGAYDAIFRAVGVRHVALIDLGIDANGETNPVITKADSVSSPYIHTPLHLHGSKDITIRRCRFTNLSGVWAIFASERMERLLIESCLFDNIGGFTPNDWDHSCIYFRGDGCVVADNVMTSRFGAGTTGARTAVELHGSNIKFTGNRISGFRYGVNVCSGGEGLTIEPSVHQFYADNRMTDVGSGFAIWGIRNRRFYDLVFERNDITINVAGWREFFPDFTGIGIVS